MFYLNVSEMAILDILIAGSGFTVVVIAALPVVRRDCRSVWTDRFGQMGWPSLEELPRARLTPLHLDLARHFAPLSRRRRRCATPSLSSACSGPQSLDTTSKRASVGCALYAGVRLTACVRLIMQSHDAAPHTARMSGCCNAKTAYRGLRMPNAHLPKSRIDIVSQKIWAFLPCGREFLAKSGWIAAGVRATKLAAGSLARRSALGRIAHERP